MPDPFEFPRMLCAIVPLVCCEWFAGFRRRIINEFVAFSPRHAVRTFQFFRTAAGCVPLFAAVVRALKNLPEPTAGLRRIDSVRINPRTFHVINLPARKMRAADFPSFARAIRSQDERAFPCAN